MVGPPLLDAASFAGLAEVVPWPDANAAFTARGHREHGAPGGGRLAELTEWLSGAQGVWPPRPFQRARLLVPATYPAAVAALAERAGAGVDLLPEVTDVTAAFAAGAAAVDAQVDAGADLLVLADPDTSPAAAVVVGLLTGAEPVALLPRGADATDTATWIARAQHLRDARRATMAVRGLPDALLVQLGSSPLATLAGAVLQAAARRIPMVVDGTCALAAALLCIDHQGRVVRWLQVADTSADRVHARALADLHLRPVLDLGIGTGDGTAGLLAFGVLDALATHSSAAAAAGPPAVR